MFRTGALIHCHPYIVPISTNITRAVRDRVLGLEDRPVEIQPLLNDFGVLPLRITSFAQPAHGAVTRPSETILLYTPEKDFSGLDEFSYTIQDAQGGTSSAKIIIRMKPFNDPPTGGYAFDRQEKTSSVSIFYNGTDSENDRLSFRVVDSPASGELLELSGSRRLLIRSVVSSELIPSTTSQRRKHDSAPGVVTIDVINSNNPPTLVSQTFLTKTNRSLSIDPSANDLDGDPVTFELASAPQHGIATGEDLDSVTRRTKITSATMPSPFALSMVRPTGSRDDDDQCDCNECNASGLQWFGNCRTNTPLSLTLPGRDPDGDQITFSVLTQPLHGALAGTPPKLTYTPITNFLGPTNSLTK
jgi:hypothetical protein